MSPKFDPEQFVALAGDAIIAADAGGSIVLWNPAAERIFGYTESEALGQSLDLIIPERLRHRHWEGYRQVMKSGQSRYGTEVFMFQLCIKMDAPCQSLLLSRYWTPRINNPGS